MLKKIKWDMIASSVICTALGVILVVFPNAVNEMITYVIAACMFGVSVIEFYNFFKKNVETDFYRNDLVFGVAALVIGVVILAKRDLIISIIPIFLGIFIIISGVKKLQNSIDLIRLKINGWITVLVLSAINIIFGVIMVICASETAAVITVLIGVGLIYSGITDLFSTLWVTNRAKKYSNKVAEIVFDGEEEDQPKADNNHSEE